MRPATLSASSYTRWAYAWPLAYLAAVGGQTGVLAPKVVRYPFQRPTLIGWPTVVGAFVALFALIGLLGCGLGVLGGRSAIDGARGEST